MILHWEPQKLSAEGARIEAPKAPGGWDRGGDGRLGGLGSVVSSPSGVRGGAFYSPFITVRQYSTIFVVGKLLSAATAANEFLEYLTPTEHCSRENSVTLLNTSSQQN